MISYYELLGMIKEDKAPNKIRVHLTPGTSKLYVRENDIDDTFSYYGLLNENEETDEYKYYLSECLLESSMFDKNIEIIEDKPNIVKEELEDRIVKAIDFLETQHNTYPSGQKWREALKDILKGGFIIEEEKDNRLHLLNDEVEIIEEKKIPKKLDIQIQNETTGNAYITNEQGTKCYLTKHSKIIAERLNQVIDYLQNKGE